MKVLLSIKPEFVQEIFTGKKKYEYRKAIFTRSVDKVVVYSTKACWDDCWGIYSREYSK